MAKSFGNWLFEKMRDYEKSKGRRVTQNEFAKSLDLHPATLSSWMNETRKPSAEAAFKLADQFKDQEILDLLGYTVPEFDTPADPSFPPELKQSFDKAIAEIERTYKKQGIIDLSSPEALEIAKRILSDHGWHVTT